jgi:DNA-binding transcriptional LysR family regulator
MDLNLQLLRHFLAIYRAGSIGRAASALSVSQPGLSKSLRRLEHDLGVVLFERHATGMVTTAYGQALARRAEVIEAESQRALDELVQIGGAMVGEISIGVGPAVAAAILPSALSSFLGERPGIRVSVLEGLYEVLVERLLAGALEFVLTTRPFTGAEDPAIEMVRFRRDRFVVACGYSHPLARRKPPLGATLADYPWVMPPRGGIIWQRFADLFLRHGSRPPDPQVETNSTGLMLSLIRTGPYLTFVPESLFAYEALHETVVILRDPAFMIEREVVILTRAGTFLSPNAAALLQALRAEEDILPQPIQGPVQ